MRQKLAVITLRREEKRVGGRRAVLQATKLGRINGVTQASTFELLDGTFETRREAGNFRRRRHGFVESLQDFGGRLRILSSTCCGGSCGSSFLSSSFFSFLSCISFGIQRAFCHVLGNLPRRIDHCLSNLCRINGLLLRPNIEALKGWVCRCFNRIREIGKGVGLLFE